MWISNTAMETWEVLKVLCNTRWKRCLPQWALLPLKYVNSGILPLWEKKGLPGTETGDIRSKSINSSRAINHFTSKWGCLVTFAGKFMQGGKKKNNPTISMETPCNCRAKNCTDTEFQYIPVIFQQCFKLQVKKSSVTIGVFLIKLKVTIYGSERCCAFEIEIASIQI